MTSRQDDLRRDLDAAVQTRKELGEEYESEIVDSFLTRLDARLDAQVDRRIAERLAEYGGTAPRERRRGWGGGNLPRLSLIMAIPLSGIASTQAGLTGLVVCWAGIVGVNIVAVLAEQREAREARVSGRSRGEWS